MSRKFTHCTTSVSFDLADGIPTVEEPDDSSEWECVGVIVLDSNIFGRYIQWT